MKARASHLLRVAASVALASSAWCSAAFAATDLILPGTLDLEVLSLSTIPQQCVLRIYVRGGSDVRYGCVQVQRGDEAINARYVELLQRKGWRFVQTTDNVRHFERTDTVAECSPKLMLIDTQTPEAEVAAGLPERTLDFVLVARRNCDQGSKR